MGFFNEMRAPTSRRYVAEEGIVLSNWLKLFQIFWLHSSVFLWEKQPKNLNFHSFFMSKKIVGDYFQKTCALTSRKYVSEPGMIIPNVFARLQGFWSQSSIFPLEKQHKNLIFQGFSSSKGPFGGYFQWNTCTYF